MIGRVRLRVADADRVRSYYERTIGLRAEGDGAVGADGTPLIELIGDPDAPPAPPGSTGLFHLALLVPDRPSLARPCGASWSRASASRARRTTSSARRCIYATRRATGSRSTATGRARSGVRAQRRAADGHRRARHRLRDGRAAGRRRPRDAGRHADGPRAPARRRPAVVGGVLRRRPGARRDGPQLRGRALPLARRLPPPRRAHTWQGEGPRPRRRAHAGSGLELVLPDGELLVRDPSGNHVRVLAG